MAICDAALKRAKEIDEAKESDIERRLFAFKYRICPECAADTMTMNSDFGKLRDIQACTKCKTEFKKHET